MFSTHFLWHVAGEPIATKGKKEETIPLFHGDFQCLICGAYTDTAYTRKEIIGDNFVDLDVFTAYDSLWVCLACGYALKTEGGYGLIKSFLATEDGVRIYKSDSKLKAVKTESLSPRQTLVTVPAGKVMETAIQDAPPDRPFMLALQSGKQKHKALRTPVNWGGRQHGFFYNKGLETFWRSEN